MEIANMVSAEAVLTCAGLTVGDINAQRLVASGIEDDLILHLLSVLPNYEQVMLAGVAPNASQPDRNATIALKNYAKWYCASTLAARPALYKQLSSDGKVRNDRFDRMDFAAMQANINALMANAWGYLQALVLPEAPVTTLPSFFGKATPAFNPITDTEV